MMKIKLRASNASSAESLPPHIDLAYSSTVVDLKIKIKRESEVPVEEQRLLYNGQQLANHQLLTHYGIKDEDTVIFLRVDAANLSDESMDGNTQATQNDSRTSSRNSSRGGLGGAGSFLGDSDQMRQMMDNPLIQSMMNNPELLRSIIQSSPEMQAVLEAQPQLNHILNDPQLWRQQMEAMRNPAMMQEMLRNQDRALSNIESLPGGYNALRRMFHDVHEPMMSATSSAARRRRNTEEDEAVEEENPSSGPHSAPLPNPWGRPTPSRTPAYTRPAPSGNQRWLSQMLNSMPEGEGPMFPFGGQARNPSNTTSTARSGVSTMPNPWAASTSRKPESSNKSGEEVNPWAGGSEKANPWAEDNKDTNKDTASPSTTEPAKEVTSATSDVSKSESGSGRFDSELRLLVDMGFGNAEENVAVLTRVNGNVDAAIDILTSKEDKAAKGSEG